MDTVKSLLTIKIEELQDKVAFLMEAIVEIQIEELQDKVAFLMEAIVEIQNTPAPGKRRRLAIKALEKIVDWDDDPNESPERPKAPPPQPTY